jgi:toxin ParE1/3/4
MRLRFAQAARQDLEDIIDYITHDSLDAGEKVYRAIVASAQRLTEFPKVGRRGRIRGTRELPVSALPYLIVYEVDADFVTILAVFHGARNSAQAFSPRRQQIK